jgi:hypothetical protein
MKTWQLAQNSSHQILSVSESSPIDVEQRNVVFNPSANLFVSLTLQSVFYYNKYMYMILIVTCIYYYLNIG